jgi:hypothetical protein
MSQSSLYITFRDTCSDRNPAGQQIALDNIVAQLLAAADRIRADKAAIYDYIRLDSSLTAKPEMAKPEMAKPEMAKPVPADDVVQTMLTTIFSKLKRTQKSEAIVKYFIENSGSELSVEKICNGTGLSMRAVTNWICQTSNKVTAVTNPARGIYKFNPDKLNN